MYTTCPECGTVFRISTTELRVAEGYVRCGQCSATFNALATLADELPPTVTPQQLTLPTEAGKGPAVEPKARSPEREAAPDAGFLSEPDGTAAPPAPEAAATYIPLPISEDTLEFDIPEDSWSNFFEGNTPARDAAAPVGPESAALPEAEARTSGDQPPPPAPADVGASIGSETVDQVGLYRALSAEAGSPGLEDSADWQALLAEVQDDEAAPVYVISEEPTGEPAGDLARDVAEEPALPEPVWNAPTETGTRAPAPLPADFATELPGALPLSAPELDAAPLTADRPFLWAPPAAPVAVRSGRHWAYTAGSGLLALLLVMQVLHQQREKLATNPTLTEPLQRTYAALGLPLWPAWDLSAYQVRNSEAIADRNSPDTLDILARIAVVGDDPVGLPFVRVTLRDGLSRPLDSRVFQPAEYLGKNPRPREPVSPGTLIPVEISLRDPGKDAQGFDVDVCIMSQRAGMLCRAEREPFLR
jgi:predicted Zn finger-like uncharacterized protein